MVTHAPMQDQNTPRMVNGAEERIESQNKAKERGKGVCNVRHPSSVVYPLLSVVRHLFFPVSVHLGSSLFVLIFLSFGAYFAYLDLAASSK